MVTVGVANGEIAYVSSSLTTDRPARPGRRRSRPLEGWLEAAAERRPRRRRPATSATSRDASSDGWTRLTVPGFAQEQQVRLRALALADGTVRPVFEANVVDVAGRLRARLHR